VKSKGVKKKQGSLTKKARKTEEKSISTKQSVTEIAYSDNNHQRQSGEISSAALRLINNSDFD